MPKKVPTTRICTSLSSLSSLSSLENPRKPHRCTLVTRLDEIIGKLFDRCCRIPCDHGVYVMANEDSLFGFDNDNAVSALLEISISKRTLDSGRRHQNVQGPQNAVAALEMPLPSITRTKHIPFWHRCFYPQPW
jgi:hypothetical protein